MFSGLVSERVAKEKMAVRSVEENSSQKTKKKV